MSKKTVMNKGNLNVLQRNLLVLKQHYASSMESVATMYNKKYITQKTFSILYRKHQRNYKIANKCYDLVCEMLSSY